MPRYTTLGTPATLPLPGVPQFMSEPLAVARRRSPGLKGGESPWVRERLRVNVVKCVKVGMILCAELLHLPEDKVRTIG